MINEWEEFCAYTGTVSYTASKKSDTTYLGRFTFVTILEFEGMARILTILARGYLFHDKSGAIVSGDPRNRIAYARRALCAWCSAPEKSKTAPKDEWQFRTDFSELRTEFPELVDADGTGWFLRHVADDDRHGSQASQLTGVFTPVARDDLITALLPGADKTGDNDAVFFYACCGFPHGFVIPDLKRVVREGMQFGQRDHDNNFLRHRLARSCGFPAALFGCGRFRHFVPPVGVWLWVEKKDTSSFQRKCPFRGR